MTQSNNYILLDDRAVLTISGPDRKDFLQSLISNDVHKISANSAIYAALLTAQGKYLHDFFIYEHEDSLCLDGEKARRADLLRRLMMYKLRADVEITDNTDQFAVYATQDHPPDEPLYSPDPRHQKMGYRLIRPATEKPDALAGKTDYDLRRLALGLPDGSRDFDVDKTLILEGNLAELNGVDFEKGCYVGQEVTARMKYRAILKKRLLPVMVEGLLPNRGSAITNRQDQKIGDIRSGCQDRAIGYFRLGKMTFGETYICGNAKITPQRPDWLKDNKNG